MKESHHSMLGTSPSPISFLGAISASLVDAWIPVFFAAWAISLCNRSSWACLRSRSIQEGRKEGKLRKKHSHVHIQVKTTGDSPGVKSNLSSNSLSNLLKATLLMKFEGPASALSWCDKHTLVEVGSGLQVLPRLFLQLLTELLPLDSSNVCYIDRKKLIAESQNKKLILCVCVCVFV